VRNRIIVGMGVGLALTAGSVWAHPGGHHHHHHHRVHVADAGRAALAEQLTMTAIDESLRSGQGDLRFRVVFTGDELPKEARDVLVHAHGGFAVDRREGHGEIYFALPGAGIIKVSRDLKRAEMVPTNEEVRNTNLHNTTIWYGDDDTAYLVFPANDQGRVYTTTLGGELVHTLGAPTPEIAFSERRVNRYFQDGGGFVPTDVAYLRGLYYITTGYSSLDYVLTASVQTAPDFDAAWSPLAFGGKGTGPGEFGTGHGIAVTPTGTRITVADRPNAELENFNRHGHYRDTINLPEGSYPCDVDYAAGYTVVGCFHGPDREQGAPIYILKDGELVSTVMPKEELGLELFTHIHNAVMTTYGGKLYLLVQSWNPGGFAILEQTLD